MNPMVLNTLLRYIVSAGGAALTAHGVSNSTVEMVAGIVTAVVPAVIGAISSTKAAQIKAVQQHGLTVVPARPENPAMSRAAGNQS